MNKTINEGEPNMVINDKPAMSPEEEFKSLRRHLQDNWKLAQEFKAHRDGFVVASIIVPIIFLLLSNLSIKPMVMDFWLALMIWFLLMAVSALIGCILVELRDIKYSVDEK